MLPGAGAAALVTQPVHGGGGGNGGHVIAPSSLLFSLLARCSFPLHALIATDSVPIQFILEIGDGLSCAFRPPGITEPSPELTHRRRRPVLMMMIRCRARPSEFKRPSVVGTCAAVTPCCSPVRRHRRWHRQRRRWELRVDGIENLRGEFIIFSLLPLFISNSLSHESCIV